MWLTARKSPKSVFWYKFAQKGYIPLSDFLIKFGLGRESQVRTFVPNFTVVALIMWAYIPKIAKNGNFWYIFAPKKKFCESTGKLEYSCTTTNLPLCNDTVIIPKITLLHSVYVITNKYITLFSSTAGAGPTIPTIVGMVIKEVRTIFAPQTF